MLLPHRIRAQVAGSAAGEFALALPVMMIFVIGAADYGVMAYQESTLITAARAGAEYAGAYALANGGTPPAGSTLDTQENMPSGTFATAAVCSCWDGSSTPKPCSGKASGPPDGAWGGCASGTTEFDYVQVTASITNYKAFISGNAGLTSLFIPSQLSATTYLRVQ